MQGRLIANFLLLAVLLILSGANWLLSRDYAGKRSTVPLLDEMYSSPALESQQSNSVLSRGRVPNTPPAGTIPRGFQPFDYPATEEGAKAAGEEWMNPLESERVHIERGKQVYQAQCSACHGTGGLGDGEVAKRSTLKPNSLMRPEAREIPDGTLYHIITFGRGNMPAHASQVDSDDRWKVILYLRSLQEME